MYRFEILTATAEIERCRAPWAEWAMRCSPFALPGFFDAWRAAFGAERVSFVIAAFRGPELQLVLPMWHPAADRRDWSSLGAFRADYTDSIAARDDEELGRAFWDWVLRSAPCHTARIALMPADSLLGRTAPHRGVAGRGRWIDAGLSLLRSGRVRYFDMHRFDEHPFADRDHIREMATKLESKHNRKNLSMLRRSGDVAYASLAGARAIAPHLATLFDMHIANFRGTDRTSQFENARERGFYESLISTPGIDATVRLEILSVGERPIAMHLGFQHADRIYWYKPAFDLELAKLSPGRLLLGHVFARAEREQLERVDLLKGTESYKNDWGNHVRTTHTAMMVQRPLGAVLTYAGRRARSYVRSAVVPRAATPPPAGESERGHA